ncbi:MAG: ATP-dependent Clp protease proteolytic subunit [Rhodobacteraceae bacterium]|nr:ATP-dependent Clp protease proteolytic subunit [Paracoccaceae bacterium]
MPKKKNDIPLADNLIFTDFIPEEPDFFQELDFDIHTQTRTICLRDDITLLTPTFLRKRINLIGNLTGDFKSPITLELSSYGGDVYGMLGAIDVIKTAPMKINTLGIGSIMSAASFLLVAGTGTRAMTENSFIMVHDINGWIRGDHSDIVSETEQLKKLQDKCYNIYATHTKKPATYWRTLIKANIYISASQAKTRGMIDKVTKTWNLLK